MNTKYVWHVRLVNQDNSIGTLALLNFLADSLKELSCAVLKIDENYYLVSKDFESLQDYREVSLKAADVLDLLWQLIKIKLHPYQLWRRPRLEIGDIY